MDASDAATVERWEEQNRRSWSALAAAWRRWHPQLATAWSTTTGALVEAAGIGPGLRVLDLASGTGEPALTIARLVTPGGQVTATDLIPEMLAVAAENAAAQGVDSIDFQPADAGSLPFRDGEFDIVTCRFGVMFFPHLTGGLGEIRRVLRPGGRAAFVVWGPMERNEPLISTIGVVMRHAPPPPPEPGAPHPGRFGQPGLLAAALRGIGFVRVREVPAIVPLPWPGTPEEFERSCRDLNPIYPQLLEGVAPPQRQGVIDEVLAALRRYDDGRGLHFSGPILTVVGEREEGGDDGNHAGN